MQQIYKRAPMPKCDFNKVLCNFFKITLRHGCSPVNLLHIFRTSFSKNTSGRLLLSFSSQKWIFLAIIMIELIHQRNTRAIFEILEGNAQFVQNMTFGLCEKMIAQLRKIFCKIQMNTRATISVMLFLLICFCRSVVWFWGVIRKLMFLKISQRW